MTYIALFFLPIALLLSYPIGWIFEKIGNRVGKIMVETRTK